MSKPGEISKETTGCNSRNFKKTPSTRKAIYFTGKRVHPSYEKLKLCLKLQFHNLPPKLLNLHFGKKTQNFPKLHPENICQKILKMNKQNKSPKILELPSKTISPKLPKQFVKIHTINYIEINATFFVFFKTANGRR